MKTLHRCWAAALAIGLCAVSGIAFNQTASSVPLVQLPNDPLYLGGARAKANLLLAMSVEAPTVGTTFWGAFNPSQVFMGYFDPMYCYANTSDTTRGEYFVAASLKATIDANCGSLGRFDGNFLNWATSSAIDILRYGLTGGNRVIDEATGEGTTILERAYLPAIYYSHIFFPRKELAAAQIALRTPFDRSTIPGNLHIRNCTNRVYFARQNDVAANANCQQPFGIANATSTNLLKPGAAAGASRAYTVRVRTCDALTAANRLMRYEPGTRRWSGLCLRYGDGSGSGFYKPVGQLQVNADNVRVGVFSYLVDDDPGRYGGVLRAPLKYVGARHFDANANLIAAANPYREWDPVTGVFLGNPQAGHPAYGDQGYAQSGAINYINRFGSLNPANMGAYKGWDPVSELYYEAFRYLQGKSAPSSAAVAGLTGVAATDRLRAENFPVYRTWMDPFAGFVDTTVAGRSCLRSSILTIADPYAHHDRSLPGNTVARYEDVPMAADTAPALNAQYWTSIVGSFESNGSLTYTGSDGAVHTAANIAGNAPFRTDLSGIATAELTATGATGSYLMAGLAYFGNTQSFRTDLPKARISTYAIDVNAYNLSVSASANDRRGLQLHLAAKYGGFVDRDGSGNPFQGTEAVPGANNRAWQDPSDGDARNFFLSSNPQKFLEAIADVFAAQALETFSIAGLASNTDQETRTSTAVFQASFNPTADYWSGRVRRLPLVSGTDGSVVVSPASQATWEAAHVLTTRVASDSGANRTIVVGAPVGSQGTVAPSAFTWGALAAAHRTALNRNLEGATDTLGEDRLNYLRGSRAQEQSPEAPNARFRARDMVLGSITNAGLVYQGAPSTALSGSGYDSFRQAQLNRTAVVFAAANDGMLHGFRDSDGQEAFAYVPGFVVPHLHALPDPGYRHRPLLDATPTAAEAYIHNQWRSVLVGGAGAGPQGVYALDVTDPDNFNASKVLWEFTDADHPALGHVIGRPHVVRLRVNAPGTGTQTHKWVALVASGVNNQRPDGHAQTNAAPSLFILDLQATPSPGTPWTEGTNFWRIELPQASTAMATGVVEMTPITQAGDGTLNTLWTGDLQGNLWKLDFTRVGLSGLGTNALDNLAAVNAMGSNQSPFFVATHSDGGRQPITSAPLLASAAGGKRLVIVGTGKYLEASDNTAPVAPGNSLYALPDGNTPFTNPSQLKTVTTNESTRQLTQSDPALDGATGWRLNLNATLGERQASPMALERGKLFVNTMLPVGESCGEGGGRSYVLDLLTGMGQFWPSEVGLLGGPFILENGAASLTATNSAGRRQATYRLNVGGQGSSGVKLSNDASAAATITLQTGRMSWRQVNRETP
jgi:type IV pilus assembly protein PilY1